MPRCEKRALVPTSIIFTVELPFQIVMTDKFLAEHFGLKTIDFFDNQVKVKELSDKLRDEIMTKVKQEIALATHHSLVIIRGQGVLDANERLDFDIEVCGLGESML